MLIHADWGSHPAKRWMCVAEPSGSTYRVRPPTLVGDLQTFWNRVKSLAGGATALVGFDFPIGLPMAYAEVVGVRQFTDVLTDFGHGQWRDFYRLAEFPAQISPYRPFYPFRPGGTKQDHLLAGLGLSSMAQLLRRCERQTQGRGPACPLFWTLGGKQVGRAAIIGWRNLLAPGMTDASLQLGMWPFDGTLSELLQRGSITVAETYPAEACLHLGLTPPGRTWSKTSQAGRLAQAAAILSWASRRRVALDLGLEALVQNGFGSEKSAEDPFDAMLGVLSMADLLLGGRTEGTPADPVVRTVEGWILGQAGDGLFAGFA